MSNRIGRMNVSNLILDDCPTFWTEYLKDVKVISQSPYNADTTTFICECEVFDEYDGDPLTAPEYLFYFDRDANGTITRRPVTKLEPIGKYWATS